MRIYVAVTVLAACVSAPVNAQGHALSGLSDRGKREWDSTRGQVKYSDADFPADDFKVEEATNGFLFGGTVGYDLPVGDGQYVGIEASYDVADDKGCEEVWATMKPALR